MSIVVNCIKDDIIFGKDCIEKDRERIKEAERNIIGWQEHIADAERVLKIIEECEQGCTMR